MFKLATPNAPYYVPYSNGVNPDCVQLPDENNLFMPDITDIFENLITDKWIHAELNLPQGEILRKAKVVSRSKD